LILKGINRFWKLRRDPAGRTQLQYLELISNYLDYPNLLARTNSALQVLSTYCQRMSGQR
jgi:hypothetical protein